MINVMNEYLSFTKKSITNYVKLIFNNKFDKKLNELFLDTYIDIRYSNYLDENTIKLSINKKISKALDMLEDSLSTEYRDRIDLVSYYKHFYCYMYGLDQLYLLETQKKIINDIYNDRVKKLKLEDENFVNEFYNMLREDIKKKKDFIDSFDSDIFPIIFKKIAKYEVGASVDTKIKFPDLYSEAAIKKVSEKDNILEDITIINFLQLSSKILSDLISCDFDTIYYAYLPGSFFDKKSKLNRVINVVDDIYIQSKLKVIITYACFVRYKSYVLELMRNGFVFGIYLDKSFDYSSDNIEYLEAFDKILMQKGKYYYKDMNNNVKIGNRIVIVDEVK